MSHRLPSQVDPEFLKKKKPPTRIAPIGQVEFDPNAPRIPSVGFQRLAPQRSGTQLFQAPSIPATPTLRSLSDFLPLVKGPGGSEFTEDLTGSVREALLGRIGERTQRGVASAQGEAARRGLTGGSFEGRRTGAAVTAGQRASADVEIGLVLEQATRQREERLLQTQRASRLQQAEAGRLFGAGEAQKQREFAKEEAAIGRQFTAEESSKVRDFNERLVIRQEKFQTLQAELQRAFTAGENEKSRQIQLQIGQLQRDNDADMARIGFKGDIAGGIGGIIGGFIGGGGRLFG